MLQDHARLAVRLGQGGLALAAERRGQVGNAGGRLGFVQTMPRAVPLFPRSASHAQIVSGPKARGRVQDPDQGCCALERQNSVGDDPKAEGFDQPDPAQADRRKHRFRAKRREASKRLAEPDKRDPARAFPLPFPYRQLTALDSASGDTAASALAGPDSSLSTPAPAASAPVCPASTIFAPVQTTVRSAFWVACPGAYPCPLLITSGGRLTRLPQVDCRGIPRVPLLKQGR